MARATLRRGEVGTEVEFLQVALKALGHDPGDVDGYFGPKTEAAVTGFQEEYERLTVDGIVGPNTWAAIEQALVVRHPTEEPEGPAEGEEDPGAPAPSPEGLRVDDDTWDAFQELVSLITDHPVCYGPGRGLFVDGRFVVTHGPGRLGSTKWRSKQGKTYPSFHCSSWTNFFMGWVARRNKDYCHAGNCVPMFKMCEAPNHPVFKPGVGTWRGYADICTRILTDGSSRKRGAYPQSKIVDVEELHTRRFELPTFIVWGRSTRKKAGGWKWWHHTGLFVIDHGDEGSPMYRIAADGHMSGGKWSATPMKYTPVDSAYIRKDIKKHMYRAYAVRPPAGAGRPAEVVLEEL